MGSHLWSIWLRELRLTSVVSCEIEIWTDHASHYVVAAADPDKKQQLTKHHQKQPSLLNNVVLC